MMLYRSTHESYWYAPTNQTVSDSREFVTRLSVPYGRVLVNGQDIGMIIDQVTIAHVKYDHLIDSV